MIKVCQFCKKEFNSRLSRYKYCSVYCAAKNRVGSKNHKWVGGRPTLNCLICNKKFLGYTHRVSKFCSQQCCGKAKIFGKEAGISPIHLWIKRRKLKPVNCEICNKQTEKLDLANKDHKYSRNVTDYFFICRSCHRVYDIKHNGYILGCNK